MVDELNGRTADQRQIKVAKAVSTAANQRYRHNPANARPPRPYRSGRSVRWQSPARLRGRASHSLTSRSSPKGIRRSQCSALSNNQGQIDPFLVVGREQFPLFIHLLVGPIDHTETVRGDPKLVDVSTVDQWPVELVTGPPVGILFQPRSAVPRRACSTEFKISSCANRTPPAPPQPGHQPANRESILCTG
jgi:hypothetical protein